MPPKTYRERMQDDPIRAFYYSPEWRRLKAQFIAQYRHLGCTVCRHPFEHTDTIHVDHIHPIKERWDLRLNYQNLRCLHSGCHTRVTHSKRPNKPVGHDGLPSDWRD